MKHCHVGQSVVQDGGHASQEYSPASQPSGPGLNLRLGPDVSGLVTHNHTLAPSTTSMTRPKQIINGVCVCLKVEFD